MSSAGELGIQLSEIMESLGSLVQEVRGSRPDLEIRHVTNHSQAVTQGTLFCAITGTHADGHDYIPDALHHGASVVVCGEIPPYAADENSCTWIRVSDGYYAWGCICESFFGRPGDQYEVHAVTGTNGKTSTAYLLRHFLGETSTALFSTVVNAFPGESGTEEAARTMPDAFALQGLFLRAKQHSEIRQIVMEASSHGLQQHRSGHLKYSSGVFTNLTGDHLDYHGDMEHYYQAKKLLFTEMLKPDAPVVINVDDEWGMRLFHELRTERPHLRLLDLSNQIEEAAIRIYRASLQRTGTIIQLRIDGRECTLKSPLIGEHNVRNLLSAFGVAYAVGIPWEVLMERLNNAPAAPGRLEGFRMPSGALAFVDYAHTDDALFRVLIALRKLCDTETRIITVFGCGGDRDRTKRPRMGKVVSIYSDLSIVTSDNPRSEDPRSIMEQVLSGYCGPVIPELIENRAEAIRRAVELSMPQDFLLIAGKGHESYQEVQGERHHFDDREVLRDLGAVALCEQEKKQ